MTISEGKIADNGVNHPSELAVESFDGQRAFQDLTAQVDFGPRTPGSIGYENTQAWLIDILVDNRWDVQLQEFEPNGKFLYKHHRFQRWGR